MKKFIFCFFTVFIFATPVFAKDIVDMNTASYVQDGDWIYYWNKFDSTLCKVKTDGTENTVLLNGFDWSHDLEDICFDDNYIYCSNYFRDEGNHGRGIFRISKIDGSSILIYSCLGFESIFYIYNDRIVFNANVPYSCIFSIKTDGTDLIKLDRADSHCYVGEKGLLYYSNYKDTGIYKIDLYGDNKEKISNNTTYYMVVENGWLYYDNRSDDGKMYKMKINGSENTKINDDDCYFCTINDGWIYYTSGQEGFSICRINGETFDKQTIVNEGYDNLNVANGYLFFSKRSTMFMVDINGGIPTEAILDKTLFGTSDDLEVLVNGKKIEITEEDTPPVMLEGRVLVPVRSFLKTLDTDVSWDEETQTANFVHKININKYFLNTVSLTLGSNIMVTRNRNGDCEEIILDVPVRKINDRIMVPLRAFAEIYDFEVSWHEDTKTAHVYGWW